MNDGTSTFTALQLCTTDRLTLVGGHLLTPSPIPAYNVQLKFVRYQMTTKQRTERNGHEEPLKGTKVGIPHCQLTHN